MAGFVSSPPAPASPPGSFVDHDGWYPGADVNGLRECVRLGSTVTHPRLVEAILGAMITVGRDLRRWKAARVAAGAATLAAVEDQDEINFEPELVHLYRRAVYAFAAADLVETHHDITATPDGRDRNETRALSADDHRRNGLHAIRDILRVGRTVVELI
ncbi:MAG TPA: head completion/stabilization protein [Allosphingosinicella sp.]|jgi:hypothetical protein